MIGPFGGINQEAILALQRRFQLSWLRVFRRTHTTQLGHGVGHEREPRGIPSEKYAARRGSVLDEMRLSTACFARALQRGMSRIGMPLLPTFQEVMPISKTRNQLHVKNRVSA